jgi:hypothetical protein
MVDLIVGSTLTHTLLLLLPAAAALLLRWARCPGWPVVGGAIAGILLGPTILGRVAPEVFERLIDGGAEERAVLDAARRRQAADLLAAQVAGADDTVIAEMRVAHGEELVPLAKAWTDARWHDQRPLRNYSAVMTALALLAAGRLRVPRGGARSNPVAAASIGLWSALLPGALGVAVAAWVAGDRHGWPAMLLAGAALAIGPWTLGGADRAAADRAEIGGARLVQTAGRVASALAIAAAVTALLAVRGAAAIAAVLALLALPVAWMLPAARPAPMTEGDGRSPRRRGGEGWTRIALEHWLVPPLTACAAINVDVIADAHLGALLALLLISGDGRWLGALVGALLPGRRRALRTMRLVLGSMSCGVTQLAITAGAAHAWALPREITFGLIVGAVAIEVLAPARRSMARRIVETETALDEDASAR